MISKKLTKARKFENEQIEKNKNEEYPLFHVTGGVGWINDPNGFSIYKGEYHLFYQHHPYSNQWGPMHWGHVKTKDFIRWERLPIAIAPDQAYDNLGCFSGSAVETADGRQLLLYTGVSKVKEEDGTEREVQQQCMAIGDGVDYIKVVENPVIPTAMIPKGNDRTDFRDPKIWREDNKYYAVVGSRSADTSGQILLYESLNGKGWKYDGIIDASQNQYGKMWECPDLFRLKDKLILMANPQEMEGESLEFHPGNNSLFLVGNGDLWTDFQREAVYAMDYGLDFYAPQTLETKDGRRIMIGWMQNWETSAYGNGKLPYMGEMTIPRELTFKNGRVYQNPVEEITNYYGHKFEAKDVEVSGHLELEGLKGRAMDLTLILKGKDGRNLEESKENLVINLAEGKGGRVSLTYDGRHGVMEMDRSLSCVRSDMLNFRRIPVETENGSLKLRILMDYHSIELFINDGAKAASMKLYSPLEADGISFESEEDFQLEIESYDLEEKLRR